MFHVYLFSIKYTAHANELWSHSTCTIRGRDGQQVELELEAHIHVRRLRDEAKQMLKSLAVCAPISNWKIRH